MSNIRSPRRLVNTPPGYKFVTKYTYQRADGSYFFEKHRFARDGSDLTKRPKEFRYYNANTGESRKPSGADDVLYRLPEVTKAVDQRETVHWTEGEKDCDALVAAGVAATSAHQGAGRVTLAQAAWLAGARSVFLWVDKDVNNWAVGAYDAALRHNLLIQCGVNHNRITIVCARGGVETKDAFDHLQRYSVDQARVVDKDALARVAAQYVPSAGRRAGYKHA